MALIDMVLDKFRQNHNAMKRRSGKDLFSRYRHKPMKTVKSAIYARVIGESGYRHGQNRQGIGLAAFICLTGLLLKLAASPLVPPVQYPATAETIIERPDRFTHTGRTVAGGWNAPIHAGTQWIFSQPVDTETPDTDPVVTKSKKTATFFIACNASRQRVTSTARPISTPLYLFHKSLLC
jgi:hypothetical protein